MKRWTSGRATALHWSGLLCSALLLANTSALAQSGGSPDPALQTIRMRLRERVPRLPKIDEITPVGMPGLYEVRIGMDIYYSDAQGNYLILGDLIETRSQRNLTRERVAKLTAIDFAKLPFKDAIAWKIGSGERRIAVFADPNCGYCKQLEAELQHLNDVTVYTFLYPVLADDSTDKAKHIWCSAEPTQRWRDWMLNNTPIAPAKDCATPIERNLALGKAQRIAGVPAVFFEDGTRSSGLMSAKEIAARIEAIRAP